MDTTQLSYHIWTLYTYTWAHAFTHRLWCVLQLQTYKQKKITRTHRALQIKLEKINDSTKYYTKYSTWVPISHRFIVMVRSYFGSISSRSFPFVSGTHITTKNRPQHEMPAYNQNAPCNPNNSCRARKREKEMGVIKWMKNIIIKKEDCVFFFRKIKWSWLSIVFLTVCTYLKVDKRFHTYECTEITKTGRYAAANAAIFKWK